MVLDETNPCKVVLSGVRDPTNWLYPLKPHCQTKLPSVFDLPSSSSSTTSEFSLQCSTATEFLPREFSPVEPPCDLPILWHRRLNHANFQLAYHMSAHGMALGLPSIPFVKHTCKTCIRVKQHRDRVPKRSATRATRSFQLVHTDLCGPVTDMTSIRYILTFIDDYSRYTWV